MADSLHIPQPSFARLQDGSWGVQAVKLVKGEKTEVYKRDGSHSTVLIGEIVGVRVIDGQRFEQARIVKSNDAPRPAVTKAAQCANCGVWAKKLAPRRDSSGLSGDVCFMCDRKPSEELSFA